MRSNGRNHSTALGRSHQRRRSSQHILYLKKYNHSGIDFIIAMELEVNTADPAKNARSLARARPNSTLRAIRHRAGCRRAIRRCSHRCGRDWSADALQGQGRGAGAGAGAGAREDAQGAQLQRSSAAAREDAQGARGCGAGAEPAAARIARGVCTLQYIPRYSMLFFLFSSPHNARALLNCDVRHGWTMVGMDHGVSPTEAEQTVCLVVEVSCFSTAACN